MTFVNSIKTVHTLIKFKMLQIKPCIYIRQRHNNTQVRFRIVEVQNVNKVKSHVLFYNPIINLHTMIIYEYIY